MFGNETRRRRKSVRGKKVDTSKSQATLGSHEAKSPPEPESLERPATLEDLRKARLSYLATPPDERKRKMKYEYVKTAKVRDTVGPEAVKQGSTVSKARSDLTSGKRSTRHKSRRPRESIKEEEDDSQYVYGPARAREHVPGAFEASDQNLEQADDHRKRSRSSKTSRHRTERRNTEPGPPQQSTRSEVIPRDAARSEQRTRQIQPTPVQDRPRPVVRRTSTSALPGSFPKASASDAATFISMSPRKSGSIFGGLFGSKSQPIERKVPCLTCGDEVATMRTAKLPCTHRMCHTCLKRIFKLSVTDPAHMPPRCCTDQAISLKHVDTLFDLDFKENYNRKLKEYKTKNKIYCPARGCGEWLQPKYIRMEKGRKIGKCPACKTYVCGICSQKMHKTRDCPKDPATKEFVETAKKAGWQKCYSCNAMVELKEGCNHMTCRCTAEFCMVCGLKWKSCDCPWFSYDQIDMTGDPIRYQQEIDRRREQEQRDEAIARRMEALQVNDDRPVFLEWINMGDGANRNMNPNFVQQARDALTANYAQGERAAQGLLNNVFMLGQRQQRARAAPAIPAMPGGWDDGPQQFEQIPHNPGRHRVNAFDPAAHEQEPAADVNAVDGVRVVRHRTHRRRNTATGPAPIVAGFESRRLTAEERERERQIRSWAMNTPNE